MAGFRGVGIACLAVALLSGAGRAPGPEGDGDWRAARWGMTEDDVLRTFPGEAKRLESPQKLADGNVVALGIEKHAIGATEFRVRFVFDPVGKLALVSLRTDPGLYAEPAAFQETRDVLAGQLGLPGANTSDANFVDMRQASWWTARSRIDVKYIPGVVVVLYSPTDGGPPAPKPAVPPLLAKPPEAPAQR